MPAGFGLYLKNARKARRLSLRQLAGLSGIDFTRLSKIENDLRPPPDPNVLLKLARILEVPLSDLLRSAGLSEDVLEGIAHERGGYAGDSLKCHTGTIISNPSGLASVKLDCGFVLHVVTDIASGRVEVAIDPSDIVLFSSGGEDFVSSARNFFQAAVTGFQPIGSLARVFLRHSSGFDIAANVTSKAVEEMRLFNGKFVGVAFKALACRIRTLPEEYVSTS